MYLEYAGSVPTALLTTPRSPHGHGNYEKTEGASQVIISTGKRVQDARQCNNRQTNSRYLLGNCVTSAVTFEHDCATKSNWTFFWYSEPQD